MSNARNLNGIPRISYKDYCIMVAQDLRYPYEVICRISECDNDHDIARIMRDTRLKMAEKYNQNCKIKF